MMNPSSAIALREIQRLPTSAARAVEPFTIHGVQYLAVAQLSEDIPGTAPGMGAGDSDVDLWVYRWEATGFTEFQRLPVPGGEDAEFFTLDGRHFLATASLRSGHGPYDMSPPSVIYEFVNGRFEPFQQIVGTAAKQWHFFGVQGRHFLALAQGAAGHGAPVDGAAQSILFEWDGERFVPFQTVESAWGYNWLAFEVQGRTLLAYADHIAPSRLLAWSGTAFETLQVLEGTSGRAFCHFHASGADWLVFANLLGETWLLRWNGAQFAAYQHLSGPGGREFAWLPARAGADGGHLVQVNFIHGSREAPIPELQSVIYRWQGDGLAPVHSFDTSGGTDAAAFTVGGVPYLAVANSLSGSLHFRTDSRIYQILHT
ncbi:hypothetical protein ASE31_00910 [Acidovorax sp. Root217]|nr:hypothetical protein ASE31_00910 [Acidovorax sp. Root217]